MAAAHPSSHNITFSTYRRTQYYISGTVTSQDGNSYTIGTQYSGTDVYYNGYNDAVAEFSSTSVWLGYGITDNGDGTITYWDRGYGTYYTRY